MRPPPLRTSSSYVRVARLSALMPDTPKRAFRLVFGGPALGGVGGTAGDGAGVEEGRIGEGASGCSVWPRIPLRRSRRRCRRRNSPSDFTLGMCLGKSQKCSSKEHRIFFFRFAFIAGREKKHPTSATCVYAPPSVLVQNL